MNKNFASAVLALTVLASVVSCKGKKENGSDASTPSTEQTPSSSEETKATNEPKSYQVTFSPDTAYLGKNKEAFIRLKNAKAIELSDADGKVTGIELSYEIEITNKQALGTSSVFINPSNFRLQLDNGTNITHDNYNSVSVQPESTGSSTDNRFRLPVGTKPKALNLFYDETRVSVGVEMK